MRKRILSLFMALVMLFSLTTPAAWAAEGPESSDTTYGTYTDGVWAPGGTGTLTYHPDNNTTLNLSKTAKVVSNNVFDITLTVQAKTKTQVQTNAAAVVLVIDTSGSMQYCAECGADPNSWEKHESTCTHYNRYNNTYPTAAQSRMQAAKTAALSFLATYAGTDANAARWLSIVDFDDNGVLAQDWINVAGGAGKNSYNTAVSKINALAQGGGTNLDDGLYDANTQMNKTTVSGITAKSVIALTDGAPTYSRNHGDGYYGSADINSDTAATAATLRSKADLYTVCFGVANDYTWTDRVWQNYQMVTIYGPTVGDFLRDSVAKSGCAYNADNTAELMAAFKAITEDITEGIESKQVSDPMGEGVAVPSLPDTPGVSGTSSNLTWELQDTAGVKDGDYTVYTYTMTYRIELDATAIGFKENAWHPANGVTTLNWAEGQTYQFPVPGLKGVVPVFTVKYQQGEHGVLMVGDTATDEVVHPDLKMHTATPAAPTVEADEGYYFTGWSPAVTATVTGDVTYVAQYAPKTVITVTAISGSKEYNGAAQSISGYSIAGLDDGYNLGGLSATVSGTNVGTYDNKVTGTPVITKGDKDVTEQFTVKTISGKLEITKKALTITADSDSKVYDGTALTKDSYTNTELAAGDAITSVTVTGSRTEVGTSANVPSAAIIKDGDEDVTANYDITYVNGTLAVTEREGVTVTIRENSGSFTYNGTTQSVTGYEIVKIESKDNLYTKDDFKFVGTDADQTVSGKDVGTYNMGLTESHFQNTNPNFKNVKFVIENGTLTINKKDVTITSATDSKTYDGKALTNSNVTAEGFVDGEGATYNVTGTRTDVGTSDNTFTYTLNEGTLASNYNITKTEGTLTVTSVTDKVTVTITENSGTEKYDGTEKTVTGYKVTGISNTLYTEADFTFNGDATIKGTDAGTYNMELKPADFTNVSKNFSNVEFVIVDGTLVITKRAVTLTSADAEQVYNGNALTNSTVSVSGDGFADGEGATYDVTGSQTDKGESKNTFTYALTDATKADNYVITKVEGTLTVTALTDKVTVTITENSGTEKYDGTEKTVTGYKVTSISNDLYKESYFSFSGTDSVSGINAGTYDMELTDEDFTNISENFANVKFVIVDGQLTITKMALTITAASGEKIYDGTALTDNGYENTALALGDAIESVSVVGSQTFVGSSANVASAAVIKDGDEDVTANYDITYVDGLLTVTKKGGIVVTITENSGEYTYDATEKTVEGYTAAINSTLYTVEDFEFSGEAVVKGTDAGTYDMELKAEDFANINENFEDVKFVIVDGTLTIKVRPITVTINGNTDSKVYNGAEQSVEGYTVEIADTLYTEEDIAFTGEAIAKGTDVGTYAMGLTAEQFSNTNENFTVTFEVNDGELEITPLTGVVVTITENSGEFVYDGTVKTVEGYTVATSSELYTVEDFTFSGTDSVSGTYVGAYDMELKAEDFANTNPNFANVIFQIVDGQLVITPVQTAIVITADSNEKVYDGSALTDDGFTYTQGVLMAGDYITAVVEGSQTNVGSSANVVTSFKVLRDTGSVAREIVDVTANYANITTEDGTLTVTKRPVTLTSGSDSKVYDGTALTKEEVTVTGDGFAEGEGAAYSEFASITEVGSTANTFTYTLNEGTDAANYDITVVEGVLTVNKHTNAKLEATGYTGVYDGKLHDGVTDKAVVGGVEGDEWTYTYSTDGENFTAEMPQYQDVGTYTVYVKATNPNYEGDALTTTVPVVITPATIVVTADDHTIATGDADPELTYQVFTPVATETPAFTGILVREEGTGKGEYAIEQGTLALTDGEGFKASNYVLEFVPGTLTILQRAIDVEKTVDVEKAFVGDTITYTFVVTNTGEVDLETVVLVDEMLQIAGEIGALAIGESWTGTATYVATAEDVGKTLINTVMVLAEGDTFDEDDSEGTVIYAPVPQTGDEMPLGLLSGAMLVSLAGVIVLLLSQRKNKADQAE